MRYLYISIPQIVLLSTFKIFSIVFIAKIVATIYYDLINAIQTINTNKYYI